MLAGLTAVDVFFLESIDDPTTPNNENEFTWTIPDHNAVADRIGSGFYWWVEIANLLQIQPALTYSMRFYPGSYAEQQLQSEPIRLPSWYDFYWVNLVTSRHGVSDGSDSRTRSRAYGEYLRSQIGAANGFPVYVVYNPPGAPTTLYDGYSGYAQFGDYVNLLYKNADYPPEQTGWVFAHELGHVFYACDEYALQCQNYPNCTNCYGFAGGPRPASMNWNCELCTPNGPTACIMHAVSSYTWINHSTCEHTRRQVGWPY